MWLPGVAYCCSLHVAAACIPLWLHAAGRIQWLPTAASILYTADHYSWRLLSEVNKTVCCILPWHDAPCCIQCCSLLVECIPVAQVAVCDEPNEPICCCRLLVAGCPFVGLSLQNVTVYTVCCCRFCCCIYIDCRCIAMLHVAYRAVPDKQCRLLHIIVIV